MNENIQPPLGSNVLGGNFSLVGIPSVGASGAIFSSVAVCHLGFSSVRLRSDTSI